NFKLGEKPAKNRTTVANQQHPPWHQLANILPELAKGCQNLASRLPGIATFLPAVAAGSPAQNSRNSHAKKRNWDKKVEQVSETFPPNHLHVRKR
ncbi:MAG TPA: hypothetical protein VM680_07225, partial [Verrucomicrobiae bacterium]|nr:hypothetical protein [Verrucomicrobiae bacterium]